MSVTGNTIHVSTYKAVKALVIYRCKNCSAANLIDAPAAQIRFGVFVADDLNVTTNVLVQDNAAERRADGGARGSRAGAPHGSETRRKVRSKSGQEVSEGESKEKGQLPVYQSDRLLREPQSKAASPCLASMSSTAWRIRTTRATTRQLAPPPRASSPQRSRRKRQRSSVNGAMP